MLENVNSNNKKSDESSFHKKMSYPRNVLEETNGIDDLVENSPSDIENSKLDTKENVREE